MAEAFAKFRVGMPGAGAAHASYITRYSALEPNGERNRGSQLELNEHQVSVAAALDEDLRDRALDEEDRSDEVDPVWTWNAPSYLTADHYGLQEGKSARVLRQVSGRDGALHNRITAGITSPERRKRLEEKTAKLRAFFGSKEQFEKAKGGRTHYRVILSFDVPASNSQIRELTNEFLKETFLRLLPSELSTEIPSTLTYTCTFTPARLAEGRYILPRTSTPPSTRNGQRYTPRLPASGVFTSNIFARKRRRGSGKSQQVKLIEKANRFHPSRNETTIAGSDWPSNDSQRKDLKPGTRANNSMLVQKLSL
jgi:hypothetical protein